MSESVVVREAKFNDRVCTYWLLGGAFVFVFSCIGIPLLPLWFLFGMAITKRQLERMSCVLTTRTLEVKKGIFTRVEKTVPLEKITDLGFVQGPIMRHFGVEALMVETAGGPAGAANVSLQGIIDARDFREAVLKQRDLLASKTGTAAESAPAARPVALDAPASHALLEEIRDCLGRIESKMDDCDRK